MIKKFPKILFTAMTVGYIFAVFLLFVGGEKLIYGIICFIVAALINILYLTSAEYRAGRSLNIARNLIEKNKIDESIQSLIRSAKLNENEDDINRFFSKPIKNKEGLKNVSSKLYKALKNYDTPYFRYITAGFYYNSGDLKKVIQILNQIQPEKRTIKIMRLLGSVYFDLGDIDMSIEILKEFDPPYLPITEDELGIVYGLGINYLQKGDKEKAVEYLARVETRSPRFGNVAKILSKIDEE
jgi:tetratricopeptide (TPR) repeat protein